jgi:hypothetical protein
VAEHRVMSCHIAVGADDMAVTTATCTTSCRTLTTSASSARLKRITRYQQTYATATPLTDAALGVACKPLLDGTSKGIILQMLHEIHKHHGHYLLT